MCLMVRHLFCFGTRTRFMCVFMYLIGNLFHLLYLTHTLKLCLQMKCNYISQIITQKLLKNIKLNVKFLKQKNWKWYLLVKHTPLFLFLIQNIFLTVQQYWFISCFYNWLYTLKNVFSLLEYILQSMSKCPIIHCYFIIIFYCLWNLLAISK